MAGFYPDVPAARMPYDRDGTIATRVKGDGTTSTVTGADLIKWNDDSSGTWADMGASGETDTQEWVAFIFPELRDLSAMFLMDYDRTSFAAAVQTSTDTTNGRDGTWTSRGTVTSASSTGNMTTARTEIRTLSVAGVKAVRVCGPGRNVFNSNRRATHIYGTITAGQTPDRVRLWHPTLDQPLSDTPAYFDWGDTAQGSTATKTFRVKNNSSTLTANTITVSREALTDLSPTVVSQLDLSYDGGGYGSTASIASLAPGAISNLVTLRRQSSATAELGLGWQRIIAAAATWT